MIQAKSNYKHCKLYAYFQWIQMILFKKEELYKLTF